MPLTKLPGLLPVLSLGIALVVADAHADPPKAGAKNPTAAPAKSPGKDKKKDKADPAVPAPLEVPLKLDNAPFGAATKDVIREYEKLIDQDFTAEFEKTEPGAEQQRLEQRVQEEKDFFRNSLLELEAPPTNLDGTKLAGEFTYGNRESTLKIERAGKKRTLFFIRGKLWKVVDAYGLGTKSKWGANYQAAVAKLAEKLGVEGRALAANPAENRRNAETDWADEKLHLRAVDWGKEFALIYVDKATEARLDELRTKKAKPDEALDPSVKGVLR